MGEGHRCIHQEGVRQEVQPNMACRSRTQLRLVCYTRDKALHILLSWPGRDPLVQVWLSTSVGTRSVVRGSMRCRRFKFRRVAFSLLVHVLDGTPEFEETLSVPLCEKK